jgi:hypothetical protein
VGHAQREGKRAPSLHTEAKDDGEGGRSEAISRLSSRARFDDRFRAGGGDDVDDVDDVDDIDDDDDDDGDCERKEELRPRHFRRPWR